MKSIKNALKWKVKSVLRDIKLIISDFWQNTLAGSYLFPWSLRPAFYRMAGNKIGKKVRLSPHIFLGPGKGKLHVGGGTPLLIIIVFLIWAMIFTLGKTAILP